MMEAPSQVSWKTAFTVCAAATATVATAFFFIRTQEAWVLSVGAALLAVALDHVVNALVKRMGWNRRWAMTFVIVSLLGLVAVFFVLLVPPAVAQARALFEQLPDLLRQFRRLPFYLFLEHRFGVTERVQEAVQGTRPTEQAFAQAISAVGSALALAAAMATLLFLSVFMLVFGADRVRAFLAHTHPTHRPHYERVLHKTYAAIGGYMGGLLVICAINATLTTTFLALVTRLPFFLPLGILSGSSSLIPYAGPIVTGALITGVALVARGGWAALLTAIYFILYGQLEGNILGPLIFRRTVKLNPLVTLMAVLFIAELMGVIGAVLAVPIVAAAQIALGELLLIRRERWIKVEPSVVLSDRPAPPS